ncbi:MAG TPA: DUF2628 domain-containing protein [Rickettsia endosymbiont of Columbicola hoogstraali]|nr:DUF2628 domain-containing protein [Rickettsia endosymbiont of Columbicola hoogstraali]
MNIYAIYINPAQKNNNFTVIKESFSWTAAFLSVFWALYHKMWLPVIIAVALNIVAMAINIYELTLALKLMIMLIFGFFAADIRENHLKRNNYTLKDIVVASSQVEAELKFLERNNYVQ